MPASHLVCTGVKAHGVLPVIACKMLLEDWRETVNPLVQYHLTTPSVVTSGYMSLGAHSMI